jgi:hypothetical protein
MKNIFKILAVLFLPFILLNSCANDADRDWTTPEASFHLQNTSLDAAVLYPTMVNNPYILVWDDAPGTGAYSVVVSSKADFSTKSVLGTSEKTTLKTNIGALNTAMLQAGINPYAPQKVYVRVERGPAVSNAISFTVTPYPTAVPVITKPTAGQAITLDASAPLADGITVAWNDYTYGGDVTYTVEVAPKGSTAFAVVGTVKNVKELKVSNFAMNNIALGAGLAAGTSADLDVRVTAKTEYAGGAISKVSNVVSFKLTPYTPAFVDFYLVGGGTAVGWNASSAQVLYRTGAVSVIYTYLSNNGEFRFLGQQDWGPINYSLKTDAIKADYRYFNTWSSNLEVAGDENMKFTGNSGMYKITIDQNARSITVTPSSVPTLPTAVYLVGNVQGWSDANALPMTQVGDGVYEYSIILQNDAEFKFLGQQAWSGTEWGDISSTGNSGFIGPNGSNSNIKFNGGGQMHKITANIKLGIYKITKLL